VGKSTGSVIIREVTRALRSTLQEFITVPKTTQEWLNIANEFWQLWQFPLCLGALDGKHISIHPPTLSGSHYFNY
jgi:hypothetical protein